MKKENYKGTMEVIRNKNISIEKLELLIKGQEEAIEEDKKNGDDKSLKYHTLALEDNKKQLKEIKGNN